jgi:hypothetical protein
MLKRNLISQKRVKSRTEYEVTVVMSFIVIICYLLKKSLGQGAFIFSMFCSSAFHCNNTDALKIIYVAYFYCIIKCGLIFE